MEPKKGNQMENTSTMGEGGSGNITIDVRLLESSLEQKIEAKDLFMSPNCCIFKTPKILFRHNAKAFLPNAFSIGPYHHGKKSLKAAEKIKHKYMHDLVHGHFNIPVSKLIDVIMEIEEEAHKYYAEPIALSKQDFVEMLVLDGCFLIELFHRNDSAGPGAGDGNDPIFNTSSFHQCLLHDLILLENQIPWKVVQILHALKYPDRKGLIDKLAITFFAGSFSNAQSSMDMILKFDEQGSKHILDLLRNWIISSSEVVKSNQSPPPNVGEWESFPSATNLNEAGINFVKGKATSILDVTFTNEGTLEIPSLIIDEVTETIFRNLISFEQCTPNYRPAITSYAILMDCLIDTTKDMEILREKKIIGNWLTPADAAQSFNKLYIDTCVNEFYYNDLCNKVNRYCERCWPKSRAHLKQKYFNNPWAIVGVVVGGLIFIFTLMQTICSVVQTVKQR